MGAANSSLATSQPPGPDEITTVSERIEGADPIVERLKSLKIKPPLLKSSPSQSEVNLADILVRRPTSSSAVSGNLNYKALLELFSLYHDWLEQRTKKISEKQEEIENKIELADALAVKLVQRYNYSVSAMRTTAYNLSQVHSLEVDVGELKGHLTEVINNCDALCTRIAAGTPLVSSCDIQLDGTTSQGSSSSVV